jgi:hypothetical protein
MSAERQSHFARCLANKAAWEFLAPWCRSVQTQLDCCSILSLDQFQSSQSRAIVESDVP